MRSGADVKPEEHMDYIYKNMGLSEIKCNRCEAGYMDDHTIVAKCVVCGQVYNYKEKKFLGKSLSNRTI